MSNIQTIFEGSYENASPVTLAFRAWRKLNVLRPSCILIPGYREVPFLVVAFWGKLNSAKNVLMSDSTAIDFERKRWKEKLKSVLVRSFFSSAIVSGFSAARYLSSLGFRPSQIGYFYDVVDNDFFSSSTDRLRELSNAAQFLLPDDYFLFVGRLVEAKNIETLLRAYAAYRSTGGRWSLVIVGKGPLEASLRETAEGLGLSSYIQFRGFESYEKLPSYYAFARCLVLPSQLDQWGLVVNEAMASGLPVIVSNRCGCAEDLVQDGMNGFIFDATSDSALANCLWRISSLDSDRWREMCAISKQIVSRYSLEAWCLEVLRMRNGQAKPEPPPTFTERLPDS
jgi:glycosyltransferase involved in cell wall biosynthesis